MKHREVRALSHLAVRAAGDTPPTITGYAAVFNQSADIGWFHEMFLPGAFARALRESQDVRALVDHDPALILGRTKPGTLALHEDDHGLAVEITVPDTQLGRDTVESIKRGDLDGMSIGFSVRTDTWRMQDGADLREVMDVDLFDISIVAYPAFIGTSAQVRSAAGLIGIDDDDLLRALLRAKHHLTLRPEDRAFLREVRQWLDPAIVTDPEPWTADLLRRRVRLASAA
ncbi:MAG: HK97 family phage prohead protease [Pseudonocardiaceae bacterium]